MGFLYPVPSSGFLIPLINKQRCAKGNDSCSEMNPEVSRSKPDVTSDRSESMSDTGLQSRVKFKWSFFLLLM